MADVTPQDLQGMIQHHLSTPVNGYLGSGYGSALKDLLQQPLGVGVADDVIRKARQDLPILQRLPAGAINIYAETVGPDRLNLIFEAGGVDVPFATVPQPGSDAASSLHSVLHHQLPAAAK